MNIKYLMLAVIIYICGEYLWISKILFSELNSIITYIEDISINDKAKSFKANLSFHPKYLFFDFIMYSTIIFFCDLETAMNHTDNNNGIATLKNVSKNWR